MPQPRTTSDVESPVRERSIRLRNRATGTERRVGVAAARNRAGDLTRGSRAGRARPRNIRGRI